MAELEARARIIKRWAPKRAGIESERARIPVWAHHLAIGGYLEQGWAAFDQKQSGKVVATGAWGDHIYLMGDGSIACSQYPDGIDVARAKLAPSASGAGIREAAATFAAEQATPPEGVQAAQWIVWSNEHRAFWAPNRCGYTAHIDRAGRYSREEAENICRYANPRANSTINVGTPPEICMPAPEALAATPSAQPAGSATSAGEGWQDIATAETEQERLRVLGYGFFRDRPGGLSVQIMDWTKWIGNWSVACLPFRPLMWRPLPAPPAAFDGGKA